MKRCFRILLVFSLLTSGTSQCQARELFSLISGVIMTGAGFYLINDGISTVKKMEYGDISKPAYKMENTSYDKASSAPYTVTDAKGTIVNTGNVALKEVKIQGKYVNEEEGLSEIVTVNNPDLALNASATWALPAANCGNIEPSKLRFSATYTYDHIFGFAEVERQKSEASIYFGILSITIGGFLIISYFTEFDLTFLEYAKKKYDFDIKLVNDPGFPKILFTKKM